MTADARDVVATVAGHAVRVDEVDARERQLRSTRLASALPRSGTSEGRQLRRWLTQLVVTERVIAAEAEALRIDAADAASESELLPDTVARMEVGSVAAAVLDRPLARALFTTVTAGVVIPDRDVADYHHRNPDRFATATRDASGWQHPTSRPALSEVQAVIAAHLLAAARRRAFRRWLDARTAALVELSAGYEHPGDPRQPDNTHRH